MTTLTVSNAVEAIAFYKKAFDAQELYRFEADGRIGHSELRIGGSTVCVTDEWPGSGSVPPPASGPVHSGLFIIVDNADAWLKRVTDAGATLMMGPIDAFYGHRFGVVTDPYGHRWNISEVREIVSEEEMKRRFAAECAKGTSCGVSQK